MNAITPEGIALVKRFEGFAPEPYSDPVGIRTIGYGHVVIPGEAFGIISEDQAADLLLTDLTRFGSYVRYHIKVPLTDNQFSALASLTFNEGTAPLIGTLGTKLNAGDYVGASNEFPRWVYAAGRKLDGLVERRTAEQTLFNEPVNDSSES